MSYRTIPSIDKKYQARVGLEGPFNFNGRVLYYDVSEGAYWDPKTDFYLTNEEFQTISN